MHVQSDTLFLADVDVEDPEVDVQYLQKLHELHNDLTLTERMKIEKVEKLLPNLHDKTEYVIHIRNSKQTLNNGLVLKKVHRVIKFNQNAWLKPDVDMNRDLRKKTKNHIEKDFWKLMNNAAFGKTMKIVRKHRNIKLVTTERRNYLVSEPNYHTTKLFTEDLLVIEMKKKTEIHMSKSVDLELGKILMYEFWYDHVKPKYGQKEILYLYGHRQFNCIHKNR